jgi:cell division inhibitor SepF
MGLWHKTLFYLGLVDEDSVRFDPGTGYGTSGGAYDDAPPEYPGAPRRAEQRPARPLGRSLENREPYQDEQNAFTTGERMVAGRGDAGASPPRGVQGRRVEPPMTSRRRTSTDRALTDSGVIVTPADRPPARTYADSELESEVIVARSYSDAQALADHVRASVPVVLDLRNVEPAMVRRLVDFSSGLTYALGGSMRKIAQGVVLVTPANVNITRDERRRLEELGYHQAPEEF